MGFVMEILMGFFIESCMRIFMGIMMGIRIKLLWDFLW